MKRALIAWGGWDGHHPKECADIVADLLRGQGLAAELENSTAGFADPELGRFDLIVPIISMATISKEEAQNLSLTVERGTGLAGFHGGMGDSFRLDTTYQFMVGGQFVAHPGNIISYSVSIGNRDDPITAGLCDFEYRSEQYYMHVDPGNEVLATTTFSGEHCGWTKGVVMPIAWKRHHGAGRVFYCSLGHAPSEFKVPQMRTMIARGMFWAAR